MWAGGIANPENPHVHEITAAHVDSSLRGLRVKNGKDNLGWPAEVWLNLQNHHDQQAAQESMKSTLAEIRPCPAL